MRRIIKDMLDEVDSIDCSSKLLLNSNYTGNNISEDIYAKLEQKVKKKFQEEVDRLEKSFRRIIEQLEVQ